jgi:hypothetical protein
LKTSSFPKWVITFANISVILAFLLIVLYVAPEFMNWFIPLSTMLAIKWARPFVLCFGFVLFILALLLSNFPKVFKIILTILTPVLCCISALGVFARTDISSIEVLLDSVQTGNNRYDLVQIISLGDPRSPCLLYKCDANDLACEEISFYYGDCWSREDAKLEINPTTDEVNVFIDDEWSDGLRLDFTYGSEPRTYADELELAEYDYYLVYVHTSSNYMIYQCERDSMNCVHLPFRYHAKKSRYSDLEIDEQSGNIMFTIKGDLIYMSGKTPKCYVENCFLTDK